MLTKICRICLIEKPLTKFNKQDKLKDGYDTRCRKCANAYQCKYNQEHPDAVKANALKHNKKKLEKFRDLLNELKSKPCMDCGGIFKPWQMDFDHRPGTIKKFNVSHGGENSGISLIAVKREIAKCDLVCANCHRDRTYKRTHEKR